MKKQETFSIKSNGQLSIHGIKSTAVPGAIISLFVKDIPYLSIENIKEKIKIIKEMMIESGIKNSRFFKSIETILDRNKREEIIEGLFNAILSSEGLSLLPGFGYAIAEKQVDAGMKIKRSFYENAEKVSILKVGN